MAGIPVAIDVPYITTIGTNLVVTVTPSTGVPEAWQLEERTYYDVPSQLVVGDNGAGIGDYKYFDYDPHAIIITGRGYIIGDDNPNSPPVYYADASLGGISINAATLDKLDLDLGQQLHQDFALTMKLELDADSVFPGANAGCLFNTEDSGSNNISVNYADGAYGFTQNFDADLGAVFTVDWQIAKVPGTWRFIISTTASQVTASIVRDGTLVFQDISAITQAINHSDTGIIQIGRNDTTVTYVEGKIRNFYFELL